MVVSDTEWNDTDLIRLMRHADMRAFDVFYDRYVNLVYSIAFSILGDPPLAEDVTQDVFLKIWRSLETYDPAKAKVNTWMSRIARNRAIDLLRKRKPLQRQVSWGYIKEQRLGDGVTPEDRVSQRMTKDRVRQALAKLPAEQRKALALAYFQNMTQQEIADTLGEPLGTIKTRVRLGMQKLRGLLIDEQ
jgi:RNA polymerase sigma-70 factor (ECF subfamily)